MKSFKSLIYQQKFQIAILLILTVVISFIVAIKDDMKLDEPVILDYIFTGILHPDHQPFYYFFIKGWSQLFGISNLALRSMSILIFLGTILLFYLWSHRKSASSLTAFVASFLLLINAFIVSHAIYAYFYSFFFLFILAGFILFEDMLEKKNTGYFLTAINFLAMLTAAFSYIPIVAQILYLFLFKKSKNYLKFIVLNLIGLSVHFYFVSYSIWKYRVVALAPEVGDRTFLDLTSDMAGFDRWYGLFSFSLIYSLVALLLGIYVMACFLYKREKKKDTVDVRFNYFIILLGLSIFFYSIFQILNLRENEYRYYSYLTFFLTFYFSYYITSGNFTNFKKKLAAIVLVVQGGYFSVYLKTQIFGSTDTLLEKVKMINESYPGVYLYATDVWVYDYIVTPLFKRKYPDIQLTIKSKAMVPIEKIVEKKFYLMYFKNDRVNLDDLKRNLNILEADRFYCRNCDTDNSQLLQVVKK